jgi:uncharacterized membrane protein (UPF0127 family)
VAVAAVAFACGAAGGKASSPEPASLPRTNVHHTDENWVGPPLPAARVILTDAYGGRHAVDVEVAATPEMRERGLMWRKELADGKGMLFVFPMEEEHSFWMRNTLIPLDMIFIDGKGAIVGIVQNAPPRTLVSRSVGAPSKYVLEVPGGWSARVGLQAGSRAELQGLRRIRIQ